MSSAHRATREPEELDLRLRRAARRLGWVRGLRQALWAMFGAVWAAELGLLLGGPTAVLAGLVACGLGVYGLTRMRRVEPHLAAAVADARLGTAAVSSGAEALGGAHVRWRAATVREALGALDALPLSRWVPWRAPAGWPLGLLICALLPLALLSQAETAQASTVRRLPGLLDPSQVAAGGGGGEPAVDEAGLVGWVEDVEGVGWSDLAPEVAEVLREELAAGGSQTAGGGEGGLADEADGSREGARGDGALSRGAQALAAAAAAGDRGAQATLSALEERSGAGAGGSAEPNPTGPLADSAPAATIRLDTTRRGQVRWDLRATERRYFTREPTRR